MGLSPLFPKKGLITDISGNEVGVARGFKAIVGTELLLGFKREETRKEKH